MTDTEAPVLSAERTDLLEALAKQRYFLRYTLRDLSDEQAALAPTASELCLGGLIKHVAETEEMWMNFAVGGAGAMSNGDWNQDSWNTRFQMGQTDTLESLFSEYERVAARTDELLASLPDLDAAHPLPEAPWFEAGASWSVRRVILHVIAETAQHCRACRHHPGNDRRRKEHGLIR